MKVRLLREESERVPACAKFMRHFRETFTMGYVTILDFRHRLRMMASIVW